MDVSKFDDLIKGSVLYFSRPDRFEDPFEGRFSPGNREIASNSEEIFQRLYKIAKPDKWTR
jgi:hypothetical protein